MWEWEVPVPKGLCAFLLLLLLLFLLLLLLLLPILNFFNFSHGTREPRVNWRSPQASLEWPAGNFLGRVFFPPFLPNFPLLKIFQAFSAEGAFILLTNTSKASARRSGASFAGGSTGAGAALRRWTSSADPGFAPAPPLRLELPFRFGVFGPGSAPTERS